MMKHILSSAIMALMLSAVTSQAQTILSVNFTHPTVTDSHITSSASEFAGVESAAYWNNYTISSSSGSSGPYTLNDGSSTSGLSVAAGGGTTTNPNYFESESDSPTNNDERLMWYTWGIDGNAQYTTLSLSGLTANFNAPAYELIVYFHRNQNTYKGTYQFDLDLGQNETIDQTLYADMDATGDFSGYLNGQSTTEAGADSANYVRFYIDSSIDSFELLIDNLDRLTTNNDDRAAINGFQLIAVPEPSAALLFMGGLATMLLIRRRRS